MTTVLIVDDEYLVADILSLALEDEGYLTVKAGNGAKALEILARERPELIITDYMMPGMNGIELAEAVRRNPQFGSTPIILMSGGQPHLGKERGDLFALVLSKPFADIETLVAAVKRLVSLD